MKKFIATSLMLTMLTSILPTTIGNARGEKEIEIYIDNVKIDFEKEGMPQPFINEANRTMVPIRVVSEKMGYKVEWDGPEFYKKIIISDDTNKIVMKEKNPIVDVNGKTKSFESDKDGRTIDTVYPVIIDGRTFVPIRFVSENLNCEVGYIPGGDINNSIVWIKKLPKKEVVVEQKRDRFGDINTNIVYDSTTKSWLLESHPDRFLYPKNQDIVIPPFNAVAVADHRANLKTLYNWMKDTKIPFKWNNPKDSTIEQLVFDLHGDNKNNIDYEMYIHVENEYPGDSSSERTEWILGGWPRKDIDSKENQIFIPDMTEKIMNFYFPTQGKEMMDWIRSFRQKKADGYYDEAEKIVRQKYQKEMILDGRVVYIDKKGPGYTSFRIGSPDGKRYFK